MSTPIFSVAVAHERDIVMARRRACQLARLLHFPERECTRVGTAVSEIARNAFSYAGGGTVEFSLEQGPHASLVIRVGDRGPGIGNVDEILSGQYKSRTGMGLGIIGARRLMDGFEMTSQRGSGTTVLLKKSLPKEASDIAARSLVKIADELAQKPYDLFDEVQQQNQELMHTLTELNQRQDELTRLNRELEDTNRGVVALYAELDERAENLRQADEVKSQFLSHLSHEFRTPLNGIIGLTRLLLDGSARNDEEIKQIRYIQRSAEDLTELVDDLLDLAKAQAGKLIVHLSDFKVRNLFAALRGMFRALATTESVNLVFEDPVPIPFLRTDESKVSQILRNFVSNALKFTEQGEVRVSAAYEAVPDRVIFYVSDTGIGIAPENRERIFEEFAQIENPIQKRVKGTGLGLPLCKRLAELLGGNITVTSQLGVGSTFAVSIPRQYFADRPSVVPSRLASRPKVLVIDDEEISRYLLRQLLTGPFDVFEASGGEEGLREARKKNPDLIFLDLAMPDLNGLEVMSRLKAEPATSSIPIVIITAQTLEAEEERRLAQGTVAILSKKDLARASTLSVEFAPKIAVSARYVRNS
jgi:signal transduction histidine kinase